MQFHSSFERCVSRVLYKGEWSTSRPSIMKHNKWDKCSSEVLIRCATSYTLLCDAFNMFLVARSTPRRFGKTFRCALPFVPAQDP